MVETQIGDAVTFTDSEGAEHPATVTEVYGDGPGHVDLRYEVEGAGYHARAVPHTGKAEKGAARWSKVRPKVAEPAAAPTSAEG